MRREYTTFDRLLLAAIDDCGYRRSRARANVDKFLAQARDAASRMSLDEFVAELALVREVESARAGRAAGGLRQRGEDDDGALGQGAGVPVVFVAAMHKGIERSRRWWHSRRASAWARAGAMPGTRQGQGRSLPARIREERKQREEEEGHRLLYVAMTRAEQHLVLSFSGQRRELGEGRGGGACGSTGRPRDEIHAAGPDGKEWRLRVMVADRGTDAGRRAIVAAAKRRGGA